MPEFDCPECGEVIELENRDELIPQAQEHVQSEHDMTLDQNDILSNIQGI